jgi:ABC-2 type transport system permease protein
VTGFLRAAFVIARRDFVATVWTRTFLFFLMGPLLMIAIGIVFGNVSGKMARDDVHANVAVIAGEAEFAPIAAARARLAPAFGQRTLPDLVRVEPDYDLRLQTAQLLGSSEKRILAVLAGGLDRPTLTGAVGGSGGVRAQIGLILDQARREQALARAGRRVAPVEVKVVRTEESAGSLAATRAVTARTGQLLLFTLTILLAGMLLSNLIEEKSNKVIEVLAAAVPVDAIFVGKLFAMLAVSLVGIAVWAAAAVGGAMLWLEGGGGPPAPAVGWPLFVLLGLGYYAANYLLLGALFLGIGSQAALGPRGADPVDAGHRRTGAGVPVRFVRGRPVQWADRNRRLAVPVQLADGDGGARRANAGIMAAPRRARLAGLLGVADDRARRGPVPPQRAEIGKRRDEAAAKKSRQTVTMERQPPPAIAERGRPAARARP